jgi:hypothetical protein
MHGGECGEGKEGRLEEGSFFWLKRLRRSKIAQSASTFVVGGENHALLFIFCKKGKGSNVCDFYGVVCLVGCKINVIPNSLKFGCCNRIAIIGSYKHGI